MAPTPPPPRPKLELADQILDKWKRLRAFVRSQAAREHLMRVWVRTEVDNSDLTKKKLDEIRRKRRQKLRKHWADMPSRLNPQYDGVFPWRAPLSRGDTAEATVEETKDLSLAADGWQAKFDMDRVLWQDFNTKALGDSPGPLMEMMWSRAERNPSRFYHTDKDESPFKELYGPGDEDLNDVKDLVLIHDNDNSGIDPEYGDIYQVDEEEIYHMDEDEGEDEGEDEDHNMEEGEEGDEDDHVDGEEEVHMDDIEEDDPADGEEGDHHVDDDGEWEDVDEGEEQGERSWSSKLQERPIAEHGMEIQAKIYDYLVETCEHLVGTVRFHQALEESAALPEDAPWPDIYPERILWWPLPPKGDAPDDDALLEEYLDKCKRLQPYKNPGWVDWIFMKRLADSRRMAARKVLLGMREDPDQFRDVLKETWDRQGIGRMKTEYSRSAYNSETRSWEEEMVTDRRAEQHRLLEADMGMRRTQQVRDAVLAAVHRYECWSHIFRLVVGIEARWPEYVDYEIQNKHMHQDLETNFWTLHRLLNSVDGDLEPRNIELYTQLAGHERFRPHFNRVVHVVDGELREHDYVLDQFPTGDDAESNKTTKMLARIHALQTELGGWMGPKAAMAEEVLEYSAKEDVEILPPDPGVRPGCHCQVPHAQGVLPMRHAP
ncbi:hypothetical protein PG988_007632 [Apiospora saccharicola]